MNARKLFYLLTCILLITACGKIEDLSFTSPDGDRKILVTGTKETPAAPIKVKITLQGPTRAKTLEVELPAGSLTNENVKVKWHDNMNATLTLIASDGKEFDIQCELDESLMVGE